MTIVQDAVGAEATYDAFAAAYDAFTAHHDYEGWISVLEALAIRHGLRGRTLLDAGCGTGKSFEPFLARGYAVVGCDISRGMLARARGRTGGRVELVQADVRRMEPLGRFDLVTCLDDVVNYVQDEAELVQAFVGLGANLAEDGVLVFDANELTTYRTFFADTIREERDGFFMVWHGLANRDFGPGESARAELDVLAAGPDGRLRRVTSVHRQRHFPEATVRRCLDAAGLRCVASYGQDLNAHLHAGVDAEVDTKAVYLAQRQRRA